MTRQKKRFVLETLSTTRDSPEEVNGLLIGFDVEMASGLVMRVNALKHDGLGKRDTDLKAKVLTCPKWYADQWSLEHHQVTRPYPKDGAHHIYSRPPTRLDMVIGLDMIHMFPTLANSYVDHHGMMQVWYCPFAGRYLASGNRQFPLTRSAVKGMTASYFGTVEELDEEDVLPTVAAYHSSTQLPLPLPPEIPVAVAIEPQQSALQQLDDPQCPQRSSWPEENAQVAENEHFQHTGEVRPGLRERLERFTEPGLAPRHQLKKECHQCKNCPTCMESSPDYFGKIQTDGFRKHISRAPVNTTAAGAADPSPSGGIHPMAEYQYKVRYASDPQATELPINYDVCLSRHKQLRKAFSKLGDEVKSEFIKRLTKGVEKDYWEIIDGDELDKLRQPGSQAHFLPAGYALKSASGTKCSTKCRLVLDPSGVYNDTLVKPANVEQPISGVLRKIQAVPVVACQDISEAFFRLKVDEASTNQLVFLMDWDPTTGELTAEPTPNTRLVGVRVKSVIMGVNQSPCLLSLCKADLDLLDEMLTWMIKLLSYVDDLATGLTADEIEEVQGSTPYTLEPEQCGDHSCCPAKDEQTADTPLGIPAQSMALPTPLDEVRATRHLLQGEVGKRIVHLVCLRAAKLELALRKANMPSKGVVSSLGGICPVFLNEAVLAYTSTLYQGDIPSFDQLRDMKVPEGYERVPVQNRTWYNPWQRGSKAKDLDEDRDPILTMAGPSPQGGNPDFTEGDSGDSLLGYRWDTKRDILSIGKTGAMNIFPPKRGRKPEWANMHNAADLLKLHQLKPLRHRHALSAAHGCFDPLGAAPWVHCLNKFVYRLLVLDTPLSTSADKYDDLLTDEYVSHHLFYSVEATIEATRRLAQPRSWRLPLAVDYSKVEIEMDVLCDGAWGCLAGGACLLYLVQRYPWMGENRTSIFLYGGTTGMNPLTRVHHQVDSELLGAQLATKETEKALDNLKDVGVRIQPRLISDSQTILSMFSKPAIQMTLGTGLIVTRVQDLFTYSGLHFAPGSLFGGSVDLLTRYDPKILSKILQAPEEFYRPSFLLPRVPDRQTRPVKDMRRVPDADLPHMCTKQLKYASLKGMPANLFEVASTGDTDISKGYGSTGKGAMHQKQTCKRPCGTCGTATQDTFHPQDLRLIAEATAKMK